MHNGTYKLTSSTPADIDREKTYKLAERLNASLDDMQHQLSGVVDHLNMRGSGDTPLDQITLILNDHLSSLEWLEASTVEFNAKLALLEKEEAEAWKFQQRIHQK